jgi:hypothetical protein
MEDTTLANVFWETALGLWLFVVLAIFVMVDANRVFKQHIERRKMLEQFTDQQLVDRLKDVDEDEEVNATTWEANFLNDVAYKRDIEKNPLTPKQRKSAIEIIERYS